eukprot:TRINITY_DN3090_c0_g1_i3.p2 TRINITY_DN3090_c0_g1~~TRINITY_DN3090_c0_g1_i3.p2  ORF type:complete len:173 (-),score=11.40 TRINITY_DN3090_c0_g1_i3:19-537(-)
MCGIYLATRFDIYSMFKVFHSSSLMAAYTDGVASIVMGSRFFYDIATLWLILREQIRSSRLELETKRRQARRLAHAGMILATGALTFLVWIFIYMPPRLSERSHHALWYSGKFTFVDLLQYCGTDVLLLPYVFTFSWLFGPPTHATASSAPLSSRFGRSDADPRSTVVPPPV